MSALECGHRRVPWGTCIEAMAKGWVLPDDLCPACTRAFMAALDGISGPLNWHPNYAERAKGLTCNDTH